MPRRKIPAEKEAHIVRQLWEKRNASLVAREEGVSFSKVWRLAEDAGIELTAGRAAKGHWRLPPERRAKVIEGRRANPTAPQEQIARAAGVSRPTVSRIERGDHRGAKIG